MSEFKLFTQKQFNERLALMVKSMSEANEVIQELAVHAVGHTFKSNQITPARNLVEQFPEGLRKTALVAFLEKHGQVRWDAESKTLVFHKREDVEFDAEALMGSAWHKASKEADPTSIYDVEEKVSKMLKQIERMTKNHKMVNNLSLAQYVENAVSEWKEAQAALKSGKDLEPVQTAAEQANAALVAGDIAKAA